MSLNIKTHRIVLQYDIRDVFCHQNDVLHHTEHCEPTLQIARYKPMA